MKLQKVRDLEDRLDVVLDVDPLALQALGAHVHPAAAARERDPARHRHALHARADRNPGLVRGRGPPPVGTDDGPGLVASGLEQSSEGGREASRKRGNSSSASTATAKASRSRGPVSAAGLVELRFCLRRAERRAAARGRRSTPPEPATMRARVLAFRSQLYEAGGDDIGELRAVDVLWTGVRRDVGAQLGREARRGSRQ